MKTLSTGEDLDHIGRKLAPCSLDSFPLVVLLIPCRHYTLGGRTTTETRELDRNFDGRRPENDTF